MRNDPDRMPTNGVMIAIVPEAGDSQLRRLNSLRTYDEAEELPAIIQEIGATVVAEAADRRQERRLTDGTA